MAPYMISVALFIGAISTNVMYDAFTPARKPKTSISWVISKLSVVFAIGFLEATILYLILTNCLGLAPVNPTRTYLLILAEAIAYMSMVTFFNIVLAKIGAFLMLIFLILQLSGSGGTCLLYTSPSPRD